MSFILKTFSANPTWLRIPALFCGIISLFLVYKITLQITKNHIVAYGSLALLATGAAPVYYSIHARGYTLLMFFALLSLQKLLPLFQSFSNTYPQGPLKFSWKTAWALSGLWTLATWTVPTFVFFEGALFAIFIVFIFSSRGTERALLLRGLTTLLTALVLFYIQYFIIISPEMLNAAQVNAATVSSANFFSQILLEWTRPWDSFGWLFILLALLGIGRTAVINRRQAGALIGLLFVTLIMACSAPILGLINQTPHPRVFLFLLPLFYIWVALGAWHALEWIQSAKDMENGVSNRTTAQEISFGALFIILTAWGIQDLVVRVLPQRQVRGDYQEVQKFISKLGPHDLILTSNKQHIWFYLYGAKEMRKRVDRILDDGQLDTIYLLTDFHKDGHHDAQWVAGTYGRSLWLTNYPSVTPTQPGQNLLIPEEILENSGHAGKFHFFRVKSRAVRPLVRLHSPLDSERWGMSNAPDLTISLLRNGPRRTFSFKFQTSFFIFDKQPLAPQKDVFSLDLFLVRTQIPKSAWVLYSNGRLEDPELIFNPTWWGNDLVMDHPYGPVIFQRPWVSRISLSHPTPPQPILAVKMTEKKQGGQISGMVAYRIQGFSSLNEGEKS